jgi:hypothetical protein
MNSDSQHILLLAKVEAMLSEVEERVGYNPYASVDLKTLSLQDLERVRKDLHEVLYAPPARR